MKFQFRYVVQAMQNPTLPTQEISPEFEATGIATAIVSFLAYLDKMNSIYQDYKFYSVDFINCCGVHKS